MINGLGDEIMSSVETRIPTQQVSKSRMKRSYIDTGIHASAPREGMLEYMPRIYREQIASFGWRLRPAPHPTFFL